MLFNSIEFAVFLPVVFAVYWLIGDKHIKAQNLWLLLSSYFFYGWWDWRFLTLIAFSTVIDYAVALQIHKAQKPKKRKQWLTLSLISNLGILGFFKYYNFFLDNFIEAFKFLGYNFQTAHLSIVLPVGISFYTFQTLSYTLDVYRRKIVPTRDWISFAAYVSFFPQLVAGPIERAAHLLPQFERNRKFDPLLAKDGVRQILWGLFKKIVIADTSAIYVNEIFSDYTNYSPSALWLGAFYFAFQIYGDFSGYSDIAIGTAKLFGFDLMINFKLPYFSRDIAEFWRRWHISLSSWFKDYLYIPLGGSRGSLNQTLRNVFIIFLVSGFWHGANWTFIAWGALHAFLFVPLLIIRKNRSHLGIVAEKRWFPNGKELIQMATTFTLVLISWVFFRSQTVSDAWLYLKGMFWSPGSLTTSGKLKYLLLIAFLITWEWFSRKHTHGLQHLVHWPLALRWSVYFIFTWLILYFMGEEQAFIYFQF